MEQDSCAAVRRAVSGYSSDGVVTVEEAKGQFAITGLIPHFEPEHME
jgi:hypothetical protein